MNLSGQKSRTRYRKAALHKLAAKIELATPASERWCVNADDFNESVRVYLEFADATPAWFDFLTYAPCLDVRRV